MITLFKLPLRFTKRTVTLAAILVAVVASFTVSLSLIRPAAATGECIRAPHTITVVSAQTKSAVPGSTVNYHVDIKSNDSEACGSSVYTFNTTAGLTPGWSVGPIDGTEIVDYLELTGYSVWYTSPSTAYNGAYDQVLTVSRAEEPTVTHTTLRYNVVGGQNPPVIPTPDTTAPTVAIVSPANGSVVKKKSAVTLSATASDNIGVTQIQFYVNGTLLCQGTATTCAWNVPNTRAAHTIAVKAYDAAGNVTTKVSNVESR